MKKLTRQEAKKIVHQALKKAFPGVKFIFKDTSDRLATSYSVRWEPNKEGKSPSKKSVQYILDYFSAAKRDGDKKVFLPKKFIVDGEEVIWPVDYFVAISDGELMEAKPWDVEGVEIEEYAQRVWVTLIDYADYSHREYVGLPTDFADKPNHKIIATIVNLAKKGKIRIPKMFMADIDLGHSPPHPADWQLPLD